MTVIFLTEFNTKCYGVSFQNNGCVNFNMTLKINDNGNENEMDNLHKFLRNKNQTYRHVHLQTYGKLKAHRESVPLRVSTAGIILFKNCAFGDYPPTACKV